MLNKQKPKKQIEKHCCKNMEYYLNEQKVLIYYNPIFREYFIGVKSYPWGKQTIYSCPWCGKKFPPSLVDKYIKTLLEKHEILYYSVSGKYFNESENTNLPYELDGPPEEFKSDQWWKNRNL